MKKFPPALERLLRCVGSTLSFSPRGPSSSPVTLQRTTSSTMQHRRTHTLHLGQEEGQESNSRTWHPEQCLASHQLPAWGGKSPQATWQRRGTGGCKVQLWLPCTHSPTVEQAPSSGNQRIESLSLSRQGSQEMEQPLAYLSPSKAMIGSLYSSSTDMALSTKAPTFSSTSMSGSCSCKLLICRLMRPSWSWVSAEDRDRLVL